MTDARQQLFRKVNSTIRRVIDLCPLTRLGFILTLGAISALWWVGSDRKDFVILAAMVIIFFIVATSMVFVLIGVARVHWVITQRGLAGCDGVLETGQGLDSGATIPRLSWWPFVQLSMSWTRPSALNLRLKEDGPWLTERIQPLERGRHGIVERRLTVRDIFGVSSVTLTYRRPANLKIKPKSTGFQVEAMLRQGDGDGFSRPDGQPVGDLIEMRRYGPGDPIRLILWKAYARTRRLIVRTPERAVAPLPSTAAYFVAGPDDEASASIARSMIESGILGDDLIFSADGTTQPVKTAEEAVEAVIDSVTHRLRGGADFSLFTQQVARTQLRRCILFLPGRSGPWTKRLTRMVESLPEPPTLVLTLSGNPAAQPKQLQRFLFNEDLNASKGFRELPLLYETLKDLGGPVQVIHFGEGRVLADHEIYGMGAL